ncbi:hemerythrin domain-containing protein [Gimesia sp.]|uniref:hemerythrin domain-containing protein n=1 Tax=Gimesia sp. TaxID=2024833 RepID=UPI003A8EF138
MIRSLLKECINAAFLKEIKDDNLKLYSLLENLRAFWLVSDPLVLNPEWFRTLISDLRDQLALHFALEETFGYLELAVDVDIFLSSESARLKKQHVDLYLEIVSITENIEDALYPDLNERLFLDQLSRFNDFYRTFQIHEAAEFDLIMSATYGNNKRKNISDFEVSNRK